MNAQIERVAAPTADQDSAKRRQIIEGARQVFLAQGFDAASMNEIARVAGVSKGTLYVYFANKEQLFEAIVGHECRAQGERIF
ncbi:MAG TPA: helix-turn-helix domain-containing protein, partial [Xanthobacteraceae bacterium]